MKESLKVYCKILVVVIISILSIESILRILDFHPYQVPTHSKINSDSPIFVEDSIIGYNNSIGKHHITINHQLEYISTIDKDHSRKCVYQGDSTTTNMISIFGCSFFAGMGVHDEAVFSNILQKELPEYQIKNWSISGHGLTSQYLILRNLIQNNIIPKIAIFEMASFHLDRNIAADKFLITFKNIKNAPLLYPFSTINNHGQLVFGLKKTYIQPHVFIKYSSILNILYKWKLELESSKKEKIKVQSLLIDMITDLCNTHQIQPIFFLIDHDDISDITKLELSKKNLNWLKSKVNYTDNNYNLFPIDGHPNNLAHQIYADEISTYIHHLTHD